MAKLSMEPPLATQYKQTWKKATDRIVTKQPAIPSGLILSGCSSKTEVARRLTFAKSTIYAMMASGELETVRHGRAIRVPVESITKWIQEHASCAL